MARDLFENTGFPVWGTRFRLYLPRQLFSIYFDYFKFMDYEPQTRREFARLIKPGSVVIDVGANIGYYTLIAAAKAGSQGKVHAVECSPLTLELLRENVRRNQLTNVEIHPVAAFSERGELTLNISAIGLSWFPLHENWPKVAGSGSTTKVPAVPLDELIHSRVNVVKIDAEGADLEVLKGMKRILSENPGIALIVEWAPALLQAAGKDPLELPRWLAQQRFGNMSVLEETSGTRLPLPKVISDIQTGKFSATWVGELCAQRRAA